MWKSISLTNFKFSFTVPNEEKDLRIPNFFSFTFLLPLHSLNRKKPYFFLLCLVLWVQMNSSAQSFYSVKPDYLRSRQEGSALLGRYENSYPDSSISAIHEFFPRNFSGNYGLAQPDYIMNYKVNDLGFQLSPSFITNDRFMDKDVRYYRTKGPFAELTGVAGSRQLQVLKMIFTHTYKDKVNITLKFNRYTSQGFYQKQRSYTNNVYLSSNYTSTEQ